MNAIKLPIIIWLFFVAIAISLAYFLGNLFNLFNFLYIGTFVAVGLFLFRKRWKYARLLVQFGVGLYMFVYLGLAMRENMQLSGFFTIYF